MRRLPCVLAGTLVLALLPAAARAQIAAPEPGAPPPAPAVAAAGLAIQVPALREKVAAVRVAKKRVTSFVTVSGVASPGAQLTVGADCVTDCSAMTFADRDGRWVTRLRLTTRPGRRTMNLWATSWPDRAATAAGAVTLSLLAPPQAAPAPLSPPLRTVGRRLLVMIGDSLAVGTAAPVQAALPDWDVRTDGRVGRPLAEGLGVHDLMPTTGDAVVAYSLFTNDAPVQVDALDAAVRRSVAELGPGGCALWATISRPKQGGVTYTAANERLHALAADPELAPRLRIVPWAEAVKAGRRLKTGDHVHGTPAGYAVRAQLFADAARSCPGV